MRSRPGDGTHNCPPESLMPVVEAWLPLSPYSMDGQYSVLTRGIGGAETGTKMPVLPKEKAAKLRKVWERLLCCP